MDRAPTQAVRPLVVLGGYHDPGVGPAAVCPKLRRLLTGQPVIAVSYYFDRSFDDCRKKVIDAVERACPSDDPRQTVEVDVIGLSMGGVVARYCAIERSGERKLRIARLFTVSSPHRGAIRATKIPAMSRLHRDLREGSDFLARLQSAEGPNRGYEIIPYVRLGDWIVGVTDAAPFGQSPWWLDTPIFENAHIGAPLDPKILGDIARRLRGEQPFTQPPPTPLPNSPPVHHTDKHRQPPTQPSIAPNS